MAKQSMIDVVEQKRLNDAREAESRGKNGAVPEREAVGYSSRGLQRGRQRLGLFHPRSGTLTGLPVGRRRAGGICDEKQRLCFALALWNERDPILKERLFGLTNSEANHGEDVKEYYFYIDSTPTHSYMKYLYKYPQREYPYGDLIETNADGRGRSSSTNCWTRASLTATGTLTCLSSMRRRARKTCWSGSPCTIADRKRPGCVCCRRCGSGTRGRGRRISRSLSCGRRPGVIQASHGELGAYSLYCEGPRAALHGERDELATSLGPANASPYVKDAFHAYVIAGRPRR